MRMDDRVNVATNGDRPRVSLTGFAKSLDVAPAQVVRWAWVGRIPHPTRVGRRWMWRATEVLQVFRDGPAMCGFYPSLAHYEGIRMLRAESMQRSRANRARKGPRTGRAFYKRGGTS